MQSSYAARAPWAGSPQSIIALRLANDNTRPGVRNLLREEGKERKICSLFVLAA
jgi:hypothetical protein